MFECDVGFMGFKELEPLHKVLIGPLFLLELSNSASYQILAFNSPVRVLPMTLEDYPHREIQFQIFGFIYSIDGKVRDWQSLTHTGQGKSLKNIRIFHKFSSLLRKLQLDLW